MNIARLLGFVFITLQSYEAKTITKVSFTGSEVIFSCESSFPPAWAKVNPKVGEYKTLAFAMSGQKHPNLKDPRISFSRSKSLHELRIERVSAADVGNYVCDGDQSSTFLLNVIR